jgi:hypothetical protein
MATSGLPVAVARSVPLAAPRVAPRWIRGLCLLGLAAIVVWFAQVAGLRVLLGTPDFEYFYKAGAWLLHHGSLDPGYDVVNGRFEPRGTLDWYWPFVPRLMSVLALLPYREAGFLWLGLNLVALVATLRLIGRHLSGLPPQDWPVTQLVPLLLLLPYWLWEFRLNQINALTLALMVGSIVCWERGRRLSAGFWLGLAVLLKLTPGLLVVWLTLKREYRTVAVAVLTVILAGPVGDVLVFGPTQTSDYYHVWADKALTTGSQRGLLLADRESDWRNQGLGVVLGRWLCPLNYNYHFDNDPRVQRDYSAYPPLTLNVVSLPRPVVANIVTSVLALSLIGLVWLARRPATELTQWQLRFEWALFLLAMLWFMPVMRRYHLVYALPAISLLGAGIHYGGWRSRWSAPAWIGLGLAFVAQLSLLSLRLEAMGTVLASVAALAVPLIVMLVRLGRRPAALPELITAPWHPARPTGVATHG